jgi:hypothetical protein
MPRSQWDRIKRDLGAVMARIESTNPRHRPVLLSGLAEGADRLAAFVALGRGWPLHAVLAFHRSRFEEDFPDPYAIGEFRALLDASTKVEEPRKNAYVGKPPEQAYDAVGQQLLALSDVMIAVWDGHGSQGKGGTVEVIDQARKRNIPLFWVHAKRTQAPRQILTSDANTAVGPIRGTRATRQQTKSESG